jgi:hypothetical protein
MRLLTYGRYLPLLATLVLLAAPSARAVHCFELFDATEDPLVIVTVAEMLPADTARMTRETKSVLEAPVIVDGVSGVRYFEKASDPRFRVYVIDGVPLREPDFPGFRVTGFSYPAPRPESPKLDLPNYAKEFIALQNRLMRSNDHTLVASTGTRDVSVRLGSTETVVGALRLPFPDKPHALIVTHQREAPIGFGKSGGLHSVNLYVLTDTGYQWTRFRVSGEDITPKIDLVSGDDFGLVLNVDGRPFQVAFTAPGTPASEVPIYLDDAVKSRQRKAEKKIVPPPPGPQASADLLFPMRK